MTGTAVFAPGGYRYIPAVFQYSAGVAAENGFELERVRFLAPIPLADAFAKVEDHLKTIGRPFTAFAHCELRSPSQFTDQGFIDFNKQYVRTLERWGIYRDGVNPVARTNVWRYRTWGLRSCASRPRHRCTHSPTQSQHLNPPAVLSCCPAAVMCALDRNRTASASCASAIPPPRACAKRWCS